MSSKSNIIQGIVVAVKANFCEVEIDNDNLIDCSIQKARFGKKIKLLCTSRQKLNYKQNFAFVGDNVYIECIDWEGGRGVISCIVPRKNFLSRPPVANISNVFVVLSAADPKFDFDQASRFLVSAENSVPNVDIIITKIDLIDSNDLNIKLSRLTSWGYPPIGVSIQTGKGIKELLKQLRANKISVLTGPSGVGKTSLLNYLLPNKSLRIGGLSTKLKRGRNTTRNVELYSLGEGALVADTPGFSRPNILIDPKKIPNLFPELRFQLDNYSCKFRDCLHDKESGCCIDKSWDRYSFYKQYLYEMISYYRQY